MDRNAIYANCMQVAYEEMLEVAEQHRDNLVRQARLQIAVKALQALTGISVETPEPSGRERRITL